VTIMTLEGVVEDGQIRLPANIRLPNSTRVYVVVPGIDVAQTARLRSPRLAHPEQAGDFAMSVAEEGAEEGSDAGL
jgi:hypothetical protein